MKALALCLPLFLSACALTPEQRANIGAALRSTGMAMAQQSVNQNSGCSSYGNPTNMPRYGSQRTINGYLVSCDMYARTPLIWVSPYLRSDGTYVCGHWRTLPDASLANNLGCN